MSEADARATDSKPDDMDDVPVASQDAYEEKTQNEKWVYLPDGGMKMKVREMPPFYFLARMNKHGIDVGATEDIADVEDPADLDADDIDEDEIDMSEVTDTLGLMKTIAERVIEPNGVWAEDDAPADAFDLTTLSDGDIGALMSGIMGGGDEAAKSFPDG
jgi:hypothetical protein